MVKIVCLFSVIAAAAHPNLLGQPTHSGPRAMAWDLVMRCSIGADVLVGEREFHTYPTQGVIGGGLASLLQFVAGKVHCLAQGNNMLLSQRCP